MHHDQYMYKQCVQDAEPCAKQHSCFFRGNGISVRVCGLSSAYCCANVSFSVTFSFGTLCYCFKDFYFLRNNLGLSCIPFYLFNF